MASGHVNRINRPNTWLHRPMLQNVKKALANTEPSTHGTFETCQRALRMSALGTLRKSRFSVVGAVVDLNGPLKLAVSAEERDRKSPN
jgi:hypothetical protein